MIRGLARKLAIATALLLIVLYALSTTWPDPELWHSTGLDEEFSRKKLDEIQSFQDYQALEQRLFQQLQDEIYTHTPQGPDHDFERYSAGSTADPSNREPNWNRSFELSPENPAGGILLLHGMSDSPYSLRALAESFHAQGYRVLGLRLPGHGTAPSGLLRVKWQDMAAATQLAAVHLARQTGGKPIHLVGYSTGAPLALYYTIAAEKDVSLPVPASLILLSPAIGVSPAAGLAKWNRRLSYLPGLGHLAWLDMLPEFDPYKYNSFATNAGEQVHLLTRRVAELVVKRAAGNPPPLPPTLILKSTVDATVSNSAIVDRLLTHLSAGRHEFVLFDINRRGANASLLVADPGPFTNQLLAAPDLPFTLSVITNTNAESNTVIARHKPPFSAAPDNDIPLGTAWPPATLSLSHIALPFPPDDPLYGREHPGNDREVFLGHVAIQGERGLLRLSADWLIRLRNNPFYDYLERRVIDWVDINN
jgi:pimeloyl-ACP methyl ester carboxylesterase